MNKRVTPPNKYFQKPMEASSLFSEASLYTRGQYKDVKRYVTVTLENGQYVIGSGKGPLTRAYSNLNFLYEVKLRTQCILNHLRSPLVAGVILA